MSLTLTLLSVARHTYAITRDGPVPALGFGTRPPSSGSIAYVEPPMGFAAGKRLEDAGFVAVIAEGIVVALRGTTPPTDRDWQKVIADWANDGVIPLLPPLDTPQGFPGRVHFGFYRSYLNLWPELGPAVKAMADKHPDLPVYVTGHSKGGSLCALVAWRLRKDLGAQRAIKVRTFAAARVGDVHFADAYNAALPDHIRYEFDDDIVPHLPLEVGLVDQLGVPAWVAGLLKLVDTGYGAVGQLRYLLPDGTIEGDAQGLVAQRLEKLKAALAAGKFGYIVDCHGLDKTPGYLGGQYTD
ncbi:lipase family protein [Phenylobacterium aquaticum]|uniref:lipase family protein n=1 Tax=Phenylobacterium aquaticum TaxID=1763816 RepID=UPI0026EFCFCF|nr:lipase family protein [Phenylobacterium aquaticum]